MRTTRRTILRRAAALSIAAATVEIGLQNVASAAPDMPGRILFVRDTGIWVWNNGDVSALLKRDGVSDARWSPDGRQVLLVQSGNSYSDLMIFDIAANTLMQLTFNQAGYEEGTPEYVATSAWALDPDWSEAGMIGFMSDAGSPDGTFQLWLMDQGYSAYLAPAAQYEDNIVSLSLSRDASLAAYVVQERQPDGTSLNRAILRDLSDGVAYPLAESVNAFDPAIAPDQQSVAVALRSEDGLSSDIALIDRASGGVTPITTGLQATNPTWSPDGTWVAFLRMVDFEFEVWAVPMEPAGPGKPVKLFKAAGLDTRSGLSWTFNGP